MIGFLKNWALPIAMITGAAGYPLFLKLSFLTPYLIFTMLLLTFCKISPNDMRPRRMHLWLLTIQVLGSVAVYFALLPLGKAVAEGAMVCVICPTATAAAVITHKLGGNAASLTTYTLIGNIGTAIAIPLFFPAIEPHAQISFATSFVLILGKVFPLLICPFIAAMLLRFFVPKAHAALQRLSAGAFYLWTVALAIVTAQTLSSILEDRSQPGIKIITAAATLVVCLLQFITGKIIGSRYGERISAGQALGQKNTIFAIWMAHTYLDPLSAIGPGAYVLWQNIVNSRQLRRKAKRDARKAIIEQP